MPQLPRRTAYPRPGSQTLPASPILKGLHYVSAALLVSESSQSMTYSATMPVSGSRTRTTSKPPPGLLSNSNSSLARPLGAMTRSASVQSAYSRTFSNIACGSVCSLRQPASPWPYELDSIRRGRTTPVFAVQVVEVVIPSSSITNPPEQTIPPNAIPTA